MNWLMKLTQLAKTDQTALELLRQLKTATTEDEKEKAKENGKTYIEKIESVQTDEEKEPATEDSTAAKDTGAEIESPVEESLENDSGDDCSDTGPSGDVDIQIDPKHNMAAPAFNPRLAKMGITREEELFQKGVLVRKMTREEKLEIRRTIYNKKKTYSNNLQNKFREKRQNDLAKKLADPEYQEFQKQRKFVLRIVEALKAHNNISWMLKNIDGLTVAVIQELLKNPANVNAFRAENPEFINNFKKKYGV